MDFRELLSNPFSGLRQWFTTHERFFAVNVTWTLAVAFFIVSFIYLLISLGIL